MDWYRTVNKLPKGRYQEVMRKNNPDGTFELCSVNWHHKYWDGKQHSNENEPI